MISKFQSSIGSTLFEKVENDVIFWEMSISLQSLGYQGGEVGSASPPGGNLVDGLPPASSTKTVAKRKSRELRTQMHLTMKIMFLIAIALGSVLVNDIISLSYVLRLWMEIVRTQNARAISEFYLVEVFYEGDIFDFFQETSKF